MAIEDDVLTRLKPEPLDAIKGRIRDGDILLCSGNDAFSKLIGVDLNCFRAGFYEKGARVVAVACRAAGIDRSVFNTVFNLSRQARSLPSNLTSQDSKEVDLVFTSLTRQAAMDELRGALAS